MDWRHKHCLSALECSATDPLAPDIRIMPISFALSTHHDVRIKLSSYGHIWSAISTFYLCVVRARLAQLRALPTGARHTAPQQHVVLPRRFGAPPGCSETRNRRGRGERTPGRLKAGRPEPQPRAQPVILTLPERSAFHELQTIFSGPAARLVVHRANWVPVCDPPMTVAVALRAQPVPPRAPGVLRHGRPRHAREPRLLRDQRLGSGAGGRRHLLGTSQRHRRRERGGAGRPAAGRAGPAARPAHLAGRRGRRPGCRAQVRALCPDHRAAHTQSPCSQRSRP